MRPSSLIYRYARRRWLHSHLICGIVAAVLMTVGDCCPECVPDDMDAVKVKCQDKGHDLQEAETTENSTTVCSALHELFICVGWAVPQCLDVIGTEYEHYRMTPWDCHLSHQQVHVYQELVNNGCQSEPEVKMNSQLNLQDVDQSGASSSPINAATQTHSNTVSMSSVIAALVASLVFIDVFHYNYNITPFNPIYHT